MGRFHIGTSIPARWDYVVNTSEYIGGSWPNLTYHVDYNFQWYSKINGAAIAYNNSYYTFHDQQQKVATHITVNAGQYSGVICSGSINFGWGSARSVAHAPGTSVSSHASGSGVVNLPALTIPEGTLSASLASYTHNSATINISYTSPYNYWVVKIYNTTGTLYRDNCINGANTITGLSPGTRYTFNVELWGRDGGVVIQRQITLRTDGFSYLDGNVTNTLETPIAFKVNTYSDSFSTNVAIKYGSTVLCSVNKTSSSGAFDFSYALTQAQLNAIYSSIPSALSCQGSITLTTYINGVASGTTTYTITFNVNQTTNKPVISSYAYLDTVQKAIDKTGNNQHVLQNVSVLKVQSIVASAKNGASISRYRLVVDGATFESSTTTITTNNVITNNSGIDLTVIDSRGLQYSYPHKNFTKYISYSKPVISEMTLSRVNDVEETTRLKLKSSFNRLPIGGVDKNITLKLKYRYKESSSSTWSGYVEKTGSITDSTFNYDNVIGSFDTGKAYNFEIAVSDYFYEVVALGTLLKGEFELFVGDGQVEVNGMLSVNDNPVSGVLGYKYSLGPNVNLNTLTQEGYYQQNANANTSTNLNYPVVEAGLLTVINRAYIYQTYQTYNNSGFFYRSCYNGTWYPWKKAAAEGTDGYFNNLYEKGSPVCQYSTGTNQEIWKFSSGLMVNKMTVAIKSDYFSAWGGTYIAGGYYPGNYALPFVQKPNITYNSHCTSVHTDGAWLMNGGDGSISKPAMFWLVRGDALTGLINWNIEITSIGRWK